MKENKEIVLTTEQLMEVLIAKQMTFPTRWVWDKTQQPIILHSLLRDLVMRRATFLAEWKGEKCIVKLFYEKQGIRHARREVKGLSLLKAAQVATSEVLQCNVLREGSMLVLSYLDNTTPFSQQWPHWNQQEKKDYLLKVMNNLDKLYQQGVYQSDLHLDNILWGNTTVYMVDGMGVTQHFLPGPLSLHERLNNLAGFLLEFSVSDQAILWQVLYETAAQLFPSNTNWQKLLRKKVMQQRNRLQTDIYHKVWRNCSAVTVGSLSDYDYAVKSNKKQAFEHMFSQIEQPHDFISLKQGRTCTLFHYSIENSNWVIKRYNIKSWWHGVTRAFRMTRAAHSWQNANWLQSLHIPTASPIGILQKKWGSLRRQSYFVMEYLSGESLNTYLTTRDAIECKQIIEKTAFILKALRYNQLSHGDLKADNLWVHDQKVYLLDLDSLRCYRSRFFFKRAFNRDMRRFFKNWRETPALAQQFKEALQGE
jgi:tRNA A-37 threonylcarbamoyl transferase component Bud32